MHSYDPSSEADVKEKDEVRAEPWMLALLDLNPEYTWWGPHGDYMKKSGDGWEAPIMVDDWAALDLKLDDLNEVVNFYFEVSRASKTCKACDRTGYAPLAKRVADDYYASPSDSYEYQDVLKARRWCDAITLDEAQALVDGGRLTSWDEATRTWKKAECVDEAFVERVNAANRRDHKASDNDLDNLQHDAINRHILIRARCKRLGITINCPECGGTGAVYVAEQAHVTLVLWLIHPRKGASRGVEIERVSREDAPQALAFLSKAADRNASRFAKVVRAARETT